MNMFWIYSTMTTNTNDKAQYHRTHWEGEFPTLLNTLQYQPY